MYTRSPWFYKIQGAGAEVTAELKIKIISGTKSAVWPGSEDYTLSGTMIDIGGGTNQINFEVAELIKDYIKTGFNPTDGSYTQTAANNFANLWVDFKHETFNAAGGVVNTVTSLGNMAWGGFLNYSQGSQSNQREAQANIPLLMSNRHILIPYNEQVRVPVDVRNIDEITFWCNGQLVAEHNGVSGLTQSEDAVKYYLEGSNEGRWAQRVLADGGTIDPNVCTDHLFCCSDSSCITDIYVVKKDIATHIKVEQIREYKYTPYKIVFINRYGVLQDLWMFKKSITGIKTTDKLYKRNLIKNDAWGSTSDYDLTEHQIRVLQLNGSESWTMNTGFYPEDNNVVFKELLLSEKIWLEIDSEDDGKGLYPVNIIESSLSFKTNLNDRLINYVFSFNASFDAIQNIR